MLTSPTQFIPLPSLRKEDEVVLSAPVFREKKSTLSPGLSGRVMEVCEGGSEYVVEFTKKPGQRGDVATVRRQCLLLQKRAGDASSEDNPAAKTNAIVEALVAILRTNRAILQGQVGHLPLAQVDAVLEQIEQKVREVRLSLREQPDCCPEPINKRYQ